ncbi:uncharacterized protein MELLADRAFT_84176 [Melampsora larici-populina 98AG31]|uniref:OTU domain-containing protein n=1 Tax=Melampsora larici-populina (strain 98AG31 / pathotype 3-4-7) TaxID=747676 RepID=F4SBT3_MELLP|nr:uncharacterized protein MELLADRAFT_84176 [Melampsora larici-populina 98AG31]EGF97883.1 hypothetical protein MELLADRAFT_84176 [Melampsora larici-populina 98AG31]
MTPLRRQEALMKISAIFDEEATPPISLMPAPDPVSHSPPKAQDVTDAQQERTVDSIDSFMEGLYNCSPDDTNSTFNLEDLIVSQPTIPAASPMQQDNTSMASPPQLHFTPPIQNIPSPPLLSAETSLPPPQPPLLSPATPLPPPQPTPMVTRKRARESKKQTENQKTLPVLMAKYSLHSWLERYVIEVREVEGDGHCGFRAIAVSIGRHQDYWHQICQMMQDTIKSIPDSLECTLPKTRA